MHILVVTSMSQDSKRIIQLDFSSKAQLLHIVYRSFFW